MKAYKLQSLIWEFNALLDSGAYDDIAVDDVKHHARAETISGFLIDRFGEEIDLGVMEPQDWADLNAEWQRFANAINEGRKMGIENRGLCLLSAYALQSYFDRVEQGPSE
jgi:hypothetical protein